MRIRKTERGSPRQMLRKLPRAMREAMAETGEKWHREMMPGHFTNEAKAKYAYEPRTKGYEIRKARKKGHRKPLVFSGDSERAAKTAVRITSRMNRADGSVRGTVAMAVPRYMYRYKKFAGLRIGPDKAAELTRTTAQEEMALERHFLAAARQRLDPASVPAETTNLN